MKCTKKELEKRICTLEKQANNGVSTEEFYKLYKQVKCGIEVKSNDVQGHEFKFKSQGRWTTVGYTMGGLTFNHFDNTNKEFGVFVCIHCGIVMTRKLTIKEKNAIKNLNL